MLTEHKTEMQHYFKYEEGLLQGECKRWFSNKRLFVKKSYQDSRLQGEYKRWYENGQLVEQTFYKNSKRHGKFRFWNIDGTLREHGYCHHGVDITEEVYKLLKDPLNPTDEEQMLIKLKYGMK